MVDIHSHILPGIDDGAKDWQEAIDMAKSAEKNGIKSIVATPHYQVVGYQTTKEQVIELTRQFNEKLQEKNIQVTIYPGHEIRISGNYLVNLIDGNLLTINQNEKYVFLELPYYEVPLYTEKLIYEILINGYIPIIPHPERNMEIQESPDIIYNLVNIGALTQITSGSILGLFGKEVYKFTLDLIESNIAHMLATDSHSADGLRGFNLKEAYDRLEKFADSTTAAQFKSNSEKILLGKDLSYTEPKKVVRRKKLFGLF